MSNSVFTEVKPLFYRASHPRVVAGVCSGLARATNTDPLLYRVLLGVLAFFAGAGILLYLVAWLLLPEDGDDHSPIIAILKHKHAKTGSILTATLIIAVMIIFMIGISDGVEGWLLFAAAAIGIVSLVRRERNQQVLTPAKTHDLPTVNNPLPPEVAIEKESEIPSDN